MADIADVRRLMTGDSGLATFSVALPDQTVHSSVVNAGVLDHPDTGEPVVGVVVRGSSSKLRRLRSHPHATVLFRVGWDWVSVGGAVELVGPDDLPSWGDAGAVPGLLRDVFTSAGGSHDDWDEYDRVMRTERRTAVLLAPTTVRSNAG